MTTLDTQDIAKSSCAQALFVHVLCLAFHTALGLRRKASSIVHVMQRSPKDVCSTAKSVLHCTGFESIKMRKERELSLHIKDLTVP